VHWTGKLSNRCPKLVTSTTGVITVGGGAY
jgi:hypothetical protein